MIIKKHIANQKTVGPMIINEYKINSDFSAALIEMNGEHGKMKCPAEDRIYFILSGKGKFIIDDVENEVGPDDLIFIAKGTPYNIIGEMKYFSICSPEFNPKDDVLL